MKFLIDLHGIFDDLEFSILDTDQDGAISGLDLARSLASPASTKYIDGLLDRVRIPVALRLSQECHATAAALMSDCIVDVLSQPRLDRHEKGGDTPYSCPSLALIPV